MPRSRSGSVDDSALGLRSNNPVNSREARENRDFRNPERITAWSPELVRLLNNPNLPENFKDIINNHLNTEFISPRARYQRLKFLEDAWNKKWSPTSPLSQFLKQEQSNILLDPTYTLDDIKEIKTPYVVEDGPFKHYSAPRPRGSEPTTWKDDAGYSLWQHIARELRDTKSYPDQQEPAEIDPAAKNRIKELFDRTKNAVNQSSIWLQRKNINADHQYSGAENQLRTLQNLPKFSDFLTSADRQPLFNAYMDSLNQRIDNYNSSLPAILAQQGIGRGGARVRLAQRFGEGERRNLFNDWIKGEEGRYKDEINRQDNLFERFAQNAAIQKDYQKEKILDDTRRLGTGVKGVSALYDLEKAKANEEREEEQRKRNFENELALKKDSQRFDRLLSAQSILNKVPVAQKLSEQPTKPDKMNPFYAGATGLAALDLAGTNKFIPNDKEPQRKAEGGLLNPEYAGKEVLLGHLLAGLSSKKGNFGEYYGQGVKAGTEARYKASELLKDAQKASAQIALHLAEMEQKKARHEETLAERKQHNRALENRNNILDQLRVAGVEAKEKMAQEKYNDERAQKEAKTVNTIYGPTAKEANKKITDATNLLHDIDSLEESQRKVNLDTPLIKTATWFEKIPLLGNLGRSPTFIGAIGSISGGGAYGDIYETIKKQNDMALKLGKISGGGRMSAAYQKLVNEGKIGPGVPTDVALRLLQKVREEAKRHPRQELLKLQGLKKFKDNSYLEGDIGSLVENPELEVFLTPERQKPPANVNRPEPLTNKLSRWGF